MRLPSTKQATSAARSKKWGTDLPDGLKSPVKDGDDRKQPEFKGHWIIEAKSAAKDDGTGAPGVVLPNLKPAKPGDVQSGDYCNIDVNFGAYVQKGNKGVTCYLNNVQLISKADPVGGGRARPEAVFDEIETDAGIKNE